MIPRLIPLILTAPLLAGEITVEKGPFRIEHQFSSIAIPADPVLISLAPETWSDFRVETILDHGSEVKKGDVLISFERESYEWQLEDRERSLARKRLALATAELSFTKLKEETKLKLEAARRAKAEAEEDLKYYREVKQPAEFAELIHKTKQFEARVDGEKEELAQLKQMYEADDLTEATEEIILERQLNSVKNAEFDLADNIRKSNWSKVTYIPRRLQVFEDAAKRANIELEKAEANLPRAIKTAELELEGTKVALKRESLELDRLKKDGALLEIKSPVDGVFFYGSLDDGRWSLGEIAKTHVENGTPPTNRVIASVAPQQAPLALSARVSPGISRALSDGTMVSVTISGREDLALTGKVSNPPTVPGTDGKYPVTVTVEWPDGFIPKTASGAKCTAVVYEKEDTISVPAKALKVAADGTWNVSLKMAEGEIQQRAVERGLTSDGRIEILGGLEVGQVIVVPD